MQEVKFIDLVLQVIQKTELINFANLQYFGKIEQTITQYLPLVTMSHLQHFQKSMVKLGWRNFELVWWQLYYSLNLAKASYRFRDLSLISCPNLRLIHLNRMLAWFMPFK